MTWRAIYARPSLLEGLQSELFKLADWTASVNPILCVPMLGATARALDWTGESAGDPLCFLLTECQSQIQQHLSKFLNDKLNAEKTDDGRSTMAEAFGQGLADIACHVIGCKLTQETRVPNACR